MSNAGEGQQPNELQGRRVLIVEDDTLVSMLLEDELLDAGAKVIGQAPTLMEAFRQAKTELTNGGLDAVILDGNLGGEQVLPLANWLEEQGVPFVFATGYGGNLERGRHIAVPILVKPFKAKALIEALQAITPQR